MGFIGGILTAMVTPFDARRRARRGRRGAPHAAPARERLGRARAGRQHRRGRHADRRREGSPVGDRGRPSRGDATMIAGTGTYDTHHTVELTRRADGLGVDGMLVVTPYYNRPNRRGIKAHFEAVAAATDKPIVALQHPQPHRHRHAERPARRAGRDRQRRRGEAGPVRRSRADRRVWTCSRATTTSSPR